MEKQERVKLIDQLVYSFGKMPMWVKVATKHSMGAPDINPETGKVFKSFREVIECSSDETLETLRDDFEGNDDLLQIPIENIHT